MAQAWRTALPWGRWHSTQAVAFPWPPLCQEASWAFISWQRPQAWALASREGSGTSEPKVRLPIVDIKPKA